MPKKILIVDDEPHIRALLEQTLEDFEDEGVELLTASDGQQAWNVAQKETPDLIILDVERLSLQDAIFVFPGN